jgi:hypothetical protein
LPGITLDGGEDWWEKGRTWRKLGGGRRIPGGSWKPR